MSLQLALVVADTQAPFGSPEDAMSDLQAGLVPLLDILEATPSLRLGLHLSQTFLEVLESTGSPALVRLQALAKKKRVSFLCSMSQGGLPWLGMERDAVAQLKQHKTTLERLFRLPVRGVWPVGLAWNPIWPQLMSRVGLKYILCSSAVLVAGGAPAPVRSWVKVRNGPYRCVAMPVSERLVHLAPHAGPLGIAEELRGLAAEGAEGLVLPLSFARFSAWGAETSGAFFSELVALLGRQVDWLRLVPPELLLERAPGRGAASPPAATPLHVGVGLLQADEGSHLLDVADAICYRTDKVLAAQAPGLVGPPLDAAFHAWPEAGRLVDRISRVSNLLAGLRRRAMRDKALGSVAESAAGFLALGSTSSALFDGEGGLVGEPSVRHQAWRSLVSADDLVWESDTQVPELDQPDDGGPLSIRTGAWIAAIDPAGGAVAELCARGVGNLVNILTPLARPWSAGLTDPSLPCLVHDTNLRSTYPSEDTDPPTDPGSDGSEANLAAPSLVRAAVSVPDEPRARVPRAPAAAEAMGLPVYRRPFALFQEVLVGGGWDAAAFARGQAREVGELADGDWRVESMQHEHGNAVLVLAREAIVHLASGAEGMVHVTKTLTFAGSDRRVDVSWTLANRSREPLRTSLGIVLPFNVDGSVGPGRTVHVPGGLPRMQDAVGEAENVGDFALRYAELGLLLRVRPGRPVRVDHFPLTAPIRRRKGYQAVHQGTVSVLSWPLELWGEERRTESMVLEVHAL